MATVTTKAWFYSHVSHDVVQSSLSHEESLVIGCRLMTSSLVMILLLNSR